MLSDWMEAFAMAEFMVIPYPFAVLYSSATAPNRLQSGFCKRVPIYEVVAYVPGSHTEKFFARVCSDVFQDDSWNSAEGTRFADVNWPAFRLTRDSRKKLIRIKEKCISLLVDIITLFTLFVFLATIFTQERWRLQFRQWTRVVQVFSWNGKNPACFQVLRDYRKLRNVDQRFQTIRKVKKDRMRNDCYTSFAKQMKAWLCSNLEKGIHKTPSSVIPEMKMTQMSLTWPLLWGDEDESHPAHETYHLYMEFLIKVSWWSHYLLKNKLSTC